MNTVLIHCPYIGGHQLEYAHHLYIGAMENKEKKYIFIMPQRFNVDSTKKEWPESSNISFHILSEEEEDTMSASMLKQAYYRSKNLSKYIRMYNATEVILIELILYHPFLPLFVSSNVRVSGILYRIYLYDWKFEYFFKKVLDVFKFFIFSKCKVFDRVFILNDEISSKLLNRIYKSNKFQYLSDPVASVHVQSPIDIRSQYRIPIGNKIILHAGGMGWYKGTIEILKAIDALSEEHLRHYTFIFAGQVSDDIKVEFDYLYRKIKDRVQIIFIEGFLPFELLGNLFIACDRVLIPYSVRSQSSGIVGHAAFYQKAVIAVEGGIIGKLVRKFKLGILIPQSDYQSIMKVLELYPNHHFDNNEYVRSHTVEKFYETILRTYGQN